MILYLAHVSDWHIDNVNKDIVINRMRHLHEQIHRYAADNYEERSDYKIITIVTGDCTHDGTNEQYEELRNILKHIGVGPVFLVIGNHDVSYYGLETIGDNFSPQSHLLFSTLQNETAYNAGAYANSAPIVLKKTQAKFANTDTHKTTMIVELPDFKCQLTLIDSNTISDNIINFARGNVGEEVISHMAVASHELDDGWLRIVAMHHHPMFHDIFQRLEDADEFLKAFKNLRSLNNNFVNKILLFGHKHSYSLNSPNNFTIYSEADKFSRDRDVAVTVFKIDYLENNNVQNINTIKFICNG